ncbi:glucose 1-dehydrogenase [Archangium violaceum]|uniref:SDR family NAD(P)-dependent oxidoreductase n=1 Tax=Archangium violaceum TaxID=83451 RepID=UPI00193B7C17|nr:glucose 1-dehydrogenase [Archangium violaceum]QRK04396.1 glucose 1-dehydrogenase [Archangium violaceum]
MSGITEPRTSHVIHPSRRLEGQVALVTGGGTGIGRAAALAFAREGASVVLAGRRQTELDEVAHRVEAEGGKALAISADVARAADVEALVEGTLERFGRLDCAFNNAGIQGAFAPIADLSESDFDQVMAINLKGAWLSMKYEIAAMLRRGSGGAIVNTSSWLAKGAAVGSSVYSASKGALDAMIRAVALEVAGQGIRVNNVNPGIIDTPMLRRSVDDEMARPFVAFTPARRLGEPADVGDVAVWLCTQEARFVTGQSLLVDGGFTIAGMR